MKIAIRVIILGLYTTLISSLHAEGVDGIQLSEGVVSNIGIGRGFENSYLGESPVFTEIPKGSSLITDEDLGEIAHLRRQLREAQERADFDRVREIEEKIAEQSTALEEAKSIKNLYEQEEILSRGASVDLARQGALRSERVFAVEPKEGGQRSYKGSSQALGPNASIESFTEAFTDEVQNSLYDEMDKAAEKGDIKGFEELSASANELQAEKARMRAETQEKVHTKPIARAPKANIETLSSELPMAPARTAPAAPLRSPTRGAATPIKQSVNPKGQVAASKAGNQAARNLNAQATSQETLNAEQDSALSAFEEEDSDNK